MWFYLCPSTSIGLGTSCFGTTIPRDYSRLKVHTILLLDRSWILATLLRPPILGIALVCLVCCENESGMLVFPPPPPRLRWRLGVFARISSHLGSSSACAFCLCSEESTLHLMQDYPFSICTWLSTSLGLPHSSLGVTSIGDWGLFLAIPYLMRTLILSWWSSGLYGMQKTLSSGTVSLRGQILWRLVLWAISRISLPLTL